MAIREYPRRAIVDYATAYTVNWSPIGITDPYNLWVDVENVGQALDILAPYVRDEWMYWGGEWTPGTYPKHFMVRDGSWLMVSNKETSERAGITPIGQPAYLFDGELTVAQTLAKQVMFGVRVTSETAGYILTYRVDVVAGNDYQIFTVLDPNGERILTELNTFRPDTTGWIEFNVNDAIIPAGTAFDILGIVSEPDPTPTVFTGNWDYDTPNNESIPVSGQISHSNQTSEAFRIHKTDNDGVDRGPELSGMEIGDVISGLESSWAIQGISDEGTFFDFTVAPAVQSSPDGVAEFTFETVTATPVSYGEDIDYWQTEANIQGLLGVDVGYEDIGISNNAYGIDIQVQAANVPVDWDVAASSSSGGGSGGASGAGSTVKSVTKTDMISTATQQPSATDTPLQIVFDADSITAEIEGLATGDITCLVGGHYDVQLRTQFGRLASGGEAQVYVYLELNGVAVYTLNAELDDHKISVPNQLDGFVDLTTGDVIRVFVVRDSSGTNAGGVFGFTPALAGIPAASSVEFRLSQKVVS